MNNIIFFGCSFTDSNSGFVDSDKMYPAIVCNHFNTKEINYAKQGSGNYRTFDLISTLDFNSENFIILQLTELSRIKWYSKHLIDVRLQNTNDKCLIHVYNDEFLLYELQRHLKLTVKLLRAKKINFIIWSIARYHYDEKNNNIESFLNTFPEYVYLENALNHKNSYRVDNGYDGNAILGTGHPGPKSHQIIANKLIEKINSCYPNLLTTNE
jgi:hypothetical protein